MRNSTTILATVALGSVLAIGSATASMAGGGGGGDGGTMFIRSHGGFGGGRSFGGHPFTMSHRGFGGVRSFGGHRFVMSHGGDRGFGMRHGFNGDHRFYGKRHFGRFRDRDDFDGFLGLAPFLGPGWAYGYDSAAGYCENYRSYDPASGTYRGRDGHRYYCP
jgi:hypothetical protein